MSIQIQGAAGIVAEVDPSTRSFRVARRAREFGALGIYRVSGLSGTMAAGIGANSEIWQFRWGDATRLALIHRVILDGLGGSATAFTAGFANVSLTKARAFSASGTGGAAITPASTDEKLRTSMGSSLVTDLRIATTAALGAGTKTLEAQLIGDYSFTVGVATSIQYAQQVILYDEISTDQPCVLVTNEGIVARVNIPATGTWQFGMTVEWSEVNSY